MHRLNFLFSALSSSRGTKSLTFGLKWSICGLLLERYVFADWEFAAFLGVILIVDTVSGVIRAGLERRLSSRGFSQLFTKVLVYIMLLVVGHVMTHYRSGGHPNVFFQWFAGFLDAAMMAREALSILENCAALLPGVVPAWLLRRLAQFSETDPTTPPNSTP